MLAETSRPGRPSAPAVATEGAARTGMGFFAPRDSAVTACNVNIGFQVEVFELTNKVDLGSNASHANASSGCEKR
jgi:hypothetical protein